MIEVVNASRPMKTLDFVMTINPLPIPDWANQFIFPLAVFENDDAVMMLYPVPVAEATFDDWAEKLARLKADVAQVTIPYHPQEAEDPHVYAFDVYLAWIPNHQVAFAEMLMLQKYSETMWERYKHLAMDFEL